MSDTAKELHIPDRIRQHSAWTRLNSQIEWYDKRSNSCQQRYLNIKIAQLVLAGSIPVFSFVAASWGRRVTATMGASIAVLEGFQQLGQFSDLWVSYRHTAEQLKHEKFLFLSASGPYQDLGEEEAMKQLAARVEERVATEHTKWVSEGS